MRWSRDVGSLVHMISTFTILATTFTILATILVLSLGMTHVASTLLSGALMDRVGRRPLLLVSIALMCAGL